MRAKAAAAGVAGALGALATWDLLQTRHSILRTFPVVGHLRFALEAVGPELRQYIVTDNDQERPFSRDQRRWVYTSSKLTNRYFGFGTDNDLERVHNYVIVKHSAFPASTHSLNLEYRSIKSRITMPEGKVTRLVVPLKE